MANLTFVDAAYAGAITGGPFDGVCFYLPGGDAFHPWPPADVHARPERYRLPCWVRSNPQDVFPGDDARQCIAALKSYGVPAGALVALDSETSVDPSWVRGFVAELNGGGHPVIDYGSVSTVFGNENPDGYYWGAQWSSVRHLAAGTDMTQYVSYANEDLSEALSTLPFWDTRPPARPPAPDPTQWTEFNMSRLPILRAGSLDDPGGAGFWYVRRLQALVRLTGVLNRLPAGAFLDVDGDYGPATATAVRQVQQHYNIPADGITGPQTWSVLLTGTAA